MVERHSRPSLGMLAARPHSVPGLERCEKPRPHLAAGDDRLWGAGPLARQSGCGGVVIETLPTLASDGDVAAEA
jgi:hypothetical protein